jgi:hypothetical protein
VKSTSIMLTVIVLVFLGVATSQSAQDVPAVVNKPDQARHATAVGLLRQINTAEVVDLSTYGSFSTWDVLMAHNQQYFDDFAAMGVHKQQIPNSHLAEPPEIMPGWNLRLNVHSDGQGYDLMLQDMTDKKCAFALFTNETAVIWESRAIGCPVPD